MTKITKIIVVITFKISKKIWHNNCLYTISNKLKDFDNKYKKESKKNEIF